MAVIPNVRQRGYTRPLVLADVLPGELVRDVVLVVAYALLVGLTAQVVIPLPFTPVPITGQTFGVLLGGMALGSRRALFGMLLYLAVGLLGVPWFAQHRGGLDMLAAPSLGYIAGFVVAAALVGFLAERGFDRVPWLALAAMVAGNAVIYVLGVAWLAHVTGWSLVKSIDLGMVPFLVGDAIKALLAAALLPGAWLLVGRRPRHS